MNVRIAPSILSADFARLGDAVAAAERGGADLIHVDVMDGHFVPNITIGVPVVKSLKRIAKVPLDVHLMIENADRYIEAFAEAGAAMTDFFSVHVQKGEGQGTIDGIEVNGRVQPWRDQAQQQRHEIQQGEGYGDDRHGDGKGR